MLLNQLSIINYKNITEATLQCCPGLNCFVGLNGMGKTNILDAIYYLSFCKSHSNNIDSQNIRHDQEFFLLQGNYTLRDKTEEIAAGMKRRCKKSFKRNKKAYERLSDHIGMLPLVLVSPADSELIAEGSEERRKFMDGVIAQFDHQYLHHLLCYNNALKQRNALLKMESMPDGALLEIYEVEMVRHAGYIYEQRAALVERFVPIFQKYYTRIAPQDEVVSLRYVSQLQERNLQEALLRTRERDYAIGYTTQGIHKDDLEMQLAGFPMKRVGSQGQNKTYLIALKLAQYELLRQTHGIKPLLLLDDLFDKLDTERMARILQLVGSDQFGQIFITDTDRAHLEEILVALPSIPAKIFTVNQGTVS